jgi:glutaryl-CoA dehydrogenase
MCLDQARYGINWSTLVGAISCYDTALQYLLLRK